MTRAPFTWQDMEHWTGSDLMETVMLLSGKDEADVFFSEYVETCEDVEHAEHNLKYMAQVIGGDDGKNVLEMFGLEIAKGEVISPRQWFANSSCGVKVAS